MSIEQDILDAIEARVLAAAPEFADRIEQSARFPISSSEWPCVRIQVPNVSVDTRDGGRPGQRPRNAAGQIVISIIHDGRDDAVESAQREIGERIDAALMSEPHLRGDDGRPRTSDLKLTATGSGISGNRGATIAVRQLYYAASWRTTEHNPGALTHS